MKSSIAFAAFAVASTAVVTTPAAAQQAPVYRYCLMENGNPGNVGAILCRFNTLSQCLASRGSFVDVCMINPALTGRQ